MRRWSRMCSGERRGRRGKVVESPRKPVQDQWPRELLSDACADQLTDPAQAVEWLTEGLEPLELDRTTGVLRYI